MQREAGFRIEHAVGRFAESAVPVVPASHRQKCVIAEAQLLLPEHPRIHGLQGALERVLIEAGARDFETRSGEHTAEAALIFEFRNEPLSSDNSGRRPVGAKRALPRCLALGSHNALRPVIHDLASSRCDQREAIDVVVERSEALAQLARHVDAKSAFNGQ